MKTFYRHLSLAALVATTAACSSDDDSTNRAMAMDDATSDVANDSNTSPADAPAANDTEVDTVDDEAANDVAVEENPSIVEIAAGDENFSQLVAALTAADLVDVLSGEGPFTVFAPTDDAFEAFEEANPGVLQSLSVEQLTGILKYHVVEGRVMSTNLVNNSIAPTLEGGYINIRLGDEVQINDAVVTAADIEASNGVIHVIDTIILPPADDVVDTAVAAGSFTTLAGALTDTGLVDVLKGEGPFTVFAPSDAAFDAFEEANPGVLGSLSEEDLTDILLYHVASGWVGAADLTDGMSIPTSLEGKAIRVDLSNGVQLNSSNVTQPNVLTSNGVIHVIDSILLPPSE